MKSNVFNADKIKTFNYEDLNGKTLKIVANRNVDGLIVIGLDVETNEMYVLKNEPRIEGENNETNSD